MDNKSLKRKLRYIVIDVDGTMTDGGIYYDDHGNEWKKFNTRDAAGFFALHIAGKKIIVLTGRECPATKRRMEELGVDYLFQNVKDKSEFLEKFMEKEKIMRDEIAYIGDEMNDYLAMHMTGFKACPADASKEIRDISDYQSPMLGGQGVVRDVAEYILSEEGCWEKAIKNAYNIKL